MRVRALAVGLIGMTVQSRAAGTSRPNGYACPVVPDLARCCPEAYARERTPDHRSHMLSELSGACQPEPLARPAPTWTGNQCTIKRSSIVSQALRPIEGVLQPYNQSVGRVRAGAQRARAGASPMVYRPPCDGVFRAVPPTFNAREYCGKIMQQARSCNSPAYALARDGADTVTEKGDVRAGLPQPLARPTSRCAPACLTFGAHDAHAADAA